MTDQPLLKWWETFKKRDEMTLWIQLYTALIYIVFYTAETKSFYNTVFDPEAIATGLRSPLFAWGVFVIVMVQLCLLMKYAVLKAYNRINNNGHNIWDISTTNFKQGKFGAVTVITKFIPARKFEDLDIKTVKSNPKDFIIQNPNAAQVLYLIAEDNTCIFNNYIFSVNSKYRILSITAASIVSLLAIRFLSSSDFLSLSSLLSMAASIAMLIALLIMIEVVIAGVIKHRTDSKIKKTIKQNLQIQDHIWC
ncbi:MAG: hypothetical protein J6N72_07300, partial [Psychrobacter sp.]|nr:hypothetical protein [Psychrobacter sp.]